MKITVLGSGSWGTALSIALSYKGHEITLSGNDHDVTADVENNRMNSRYIPGVTLPDSIHATCDYGKALASPEAIVFALPSHCFRLVLTEIKDIIPTVLTVNAGKGLERGTGKRSSYVVRDVLGEEFAANTVTLSGPNLAMEVAKGLPTATVLASKNRENTLKAQAMFSSDHFRAYTSDDVAGLEIGGSFKNILAIGSGLCMGLGYGDNTKAALVARGLAEMTRLGAVFGAKQSTFMGLSGVGDIIATCSSHLSRNFSLGRMLGEGKTLEESLKALDQVAEGVETCAAAEKLSEEYNVAMPITHEIHAVLFEGKDPNDAVKTLMSRDLKSEA